MTAERTIKTQSEQAMRETIQGQGLSMRAMLDELRQKDDALKALQEEIRRLRELFEATRRWDAPAQPIGGAGPCYFAVETIRREQAKQASADLISALEEHFAANPTTAKYELKDSIESHPRKLNAVATVIAKRESKC